MTWSVSLRVETAASCILNDGVKTDRRLLTATAQQNGRTENETEACRKWPVNLRDYEQKERHAASCASAEQSRTSGCSDADFSSGLFIYLFCFSPPGQQVRRLTGLDFDKRKSNAVHGFWVWFKGEMAASGRVWAEEKEWERLKERERGIKERERGRISEGGRRRSVSQLKVSAVNISCGVFSYFCSR